MRVKGPLKREVVGIVAEIMRMRKWKSLSYYSSKTPSSSKASGSCNHGEYELGSIW